MKYLKKCLTDTKGGIYLVLNGLLTGLYLSINTLILQWLSQAIVNYQHPIHYINLVIGGCVVNTCLSFLMSYLGHMGTTTVFTYLMNIYTKKICNADYEMFSKFSPARVTTTGESIWKMSKLLKTYVDVIKAALSIITTIAAIIYLIRWYSVIVVVCYTVGGLIYIQLSKQWEKLDSEFESVKHKRNLQLDEITNGFAEVRGFSKVHIHENEVYRLNEKLMSLLKRRTIVDGKMGVLFETIDTLVMAVMLLYSIFLLREGVWTDTATGVTLIMYVWRLINPVINMIEYGSSISELKAPIPKFMEIMEYQNLVSEGYLKLDGFTDSIQFEDVKFSYDNSSNVLDGVSFEIKKGQHVGICGPSGGGKSTILKLIPEFYDVDSGSIRFDGIDVKDLTVESVRKHIGIVQQSPHIFDTTIFENVAYSRKGQSVSNEEVIRACKQAQIYDFIMGLEDQFDTKVGPHGMKLSGGQRQRIALARIFLANPDIVILDEATSALDNETESLVQEAMKLFEDKTMITVAHRLSTIKDSDKIVVIDKYQVAEEGTHDELVAKNGIYAAMLR